MINIADAVGRVMMAAVTLPRSNNNNGMETYVKTEFHKDDQAYVMNCMRSNRPVDIRNVTV